MYGITPNSLPHFARLIGAEVQQVCVGLFDLQFHLHPTGHISVWSRCELVAGNGTIMDLWEDGVRSGRFLFADLLGGTIADVVVADSSTLRLSLADGRAIVLYDTSDQYESFSVNDVYI